jgi:hypothetical protein
MAAVRMTDSATVATTERARVAATAEEAAVADTVAAAKVVEAWSAVAMADTAAAPVAGNAESPALWALRVGLVFASTMAEHL